MSYIPLGELIAPAAVTRAGDTAFPILSMTMHEGLVPQESKFKKRVASSDTSTYKVVREGQLVVGFPIDEGVLDFQNLYREAIVSPAYGVWNLKRPDDTDRSYLQKFLRSPMAMSYYAAKLQGSTARRRSLPNEVFAALPVPFPSLGEQRRIAAILDQADAIRAKRRQTLARLDTLTQSIFHQMFAGHSEHGALAELMTFRSGSFLPAREQLAGPYPVFGGNGLTGFHAEWNVERGTVVIGRVGMNCGTVSLTSERTWVTDNALIVTPRLPVEPDFLATALTLARLNQHASRSAQPLISAARIAAVTIPTPSLTLQRDFSQRIQQVKMIRQIIGATQDLEEGLLASLQVRAFRGEL